MKRYKTKVTFEGLFDVDTKEEAYDAIINYCHDVYRDQDATAFVFEEVEINEENT